MLLSDKAFYRLKRIYIGIAVGIAICLLYASYMALANSIQTGASMSSTELVLTPIVVSNP